MKVDVQNVIGLGMRWLMGESLLEAVDSEHGTQLAPMANMAVKKIDEVRSEVERTIAARDANIAAREQVAEESRRYLKPETTDSPNACPACKGVGATRVIVDGEKHAMLCIVCDGSGELAKCEVCDGNGAVLEMIVGGPDLHRPRPCKACNATGRKP